eukprot:scaffold761_cov137-Skeletonema_menzelii.AAC.1
MVVSKGEKKLYERHHSSNIIIITGCSARTFFLQFFLISLNSSSVLSQVSKTVASVMSRSPRQLFEFEWKSRSARGESKDQRCPGSGEAGAEKRHDSGSQSPRPPRGKLIDELRRCCSCLPAKILEFSFYTRNYSRAFACHYIAQGNSCEFYDSLDERGFCRDYGCGVSHIINLLNNYDRRSS